MAPQGSSPAPVRIDSGRMVSMAAGSASDPWRPMNSARSAVQVCWRPIMSMNAWRGWNAALQGLRASNAAASTTQ